MTFLGSHIVGKNSNLVYLILEGLHRAVVEYYPYCDKK